jgi:hypothetical protein
VVWCGVVVCGGVGSTHSHCVTGVWWCSVVCGVVCGGVVWWGVLG